ncbi:unnamed protein product, partial [Polarella glacialis]
MGQAALGRSAEFKAQELSNLAWAFAQEATGATQRLRRSDDEHFCRSDVDDAENFATTTTTTTTRARTATITTTNNNNNHNSQSSQGSSSLTAVSSRGCEADTEGGKTKICKLLLASVSQEARRRALQDFETRQLSGLAWALAASSFMDADLRWSVLREAAARKRIAPQGFANLLWAVAKSPGPQLGDMELASFRDVARTALSSQLGDFLPQHLATIAWALARVTASEPPSVGGALPLQEPLLRLEEACCRRVEEFKLQELSNVAWAFATMGEERDRLFEAIGGEAELRLRALDCGSMSWEELADMGLNTLGLVWAARHAGHFRESLRCTAASALLRLGRSLDLKMREGPESLQTTKSPGATWSTGNPQEPFVVLELPDRQVLLKPPGWEVDSYQVDCEADCGSQGSKALLSTFVFSAHPERVARPILRDEVHRRGFLHRLDVPSSGLILLATSYEAYYDLAFQLNSGELIREYVVLSHGWLSPWRSELRARLHAPDGGFGTTEVLARGKPSLTRLKVLLHAVSLGTSLEAFSLLSVRIITGRRHQIRAHVAHSGHPTACDGKYTAQRTFNEDSTWCCRNFLHRNCLVFRDGAGQLRKATAPLPEDLADAMRFLRPRPGGSEAALQQWWEQGNTKMLEWESCQPLAAGQGLPTDHFSGDGPALGRWATGPLYDSVMVWLMVAMLFKAGLRGVFDPIFIARQEAASQPLAAHTGAPESAGVIQVLTGRQAKPVHGVAALTAMDNGYPSERDQRLQVGIDVFGCMLTHQEHVPTPDLVSSVGDTALLASLRSRAAKLSHVLFGTHAVGVLMAFCDAGCLDANVLKALSEAIIRNLERIPAQDYIAVLTALANLPPDLQASLPETLLEEVIQALKTRGYGTWRLELEAVVHLLEALQGLRMEDEALLELVCDRLPAALKLSDCSLTLLVRLLEVLGEQPARSRLHVSTHLHRRRKLQTALKDQIVRHVSRGLDLESQVVMARAVARLGFEDQLTQEWLSRLVVMVEPQLDSLSADTACDLSWSLAQLSWQIEWNRRHSQA